MQELNTAKTLEVLEETGMDTLTVTDMGATMALSQVDEDGELHDIILGPLQKRRLIEILEASLAS